MLRASRGGLRGESRRRSRRRGTRGGQSWRWSKGRRWKSFGSGNGSGNIRETVSSGEGARRRKAEENMWNVFTFVAPCFSRGRFVITKMSVDEGGDLHQVDVVVEENNEANRDRNVLTIACRDETGGTVM